jgi:ZIP family zinc transporter
VPFLPALGYTLIPVFAAVAGSLYAAIRRPGPNAISAVQHFAAGVVFAAAAGELLPGLMHRGSPVATIVGGAVGIAVMLAVKALGGRLKGPFALVTVVGVDILIDGLVLGIGFGAGPREGILLTIALTTEVLFLGLSMAPELGGESGSRRRIIGITAALALLLPIGTAVGIPLASASPRLLAGFFAFGLVALLYLVTEELLVEAHEVPERPWVTAMLFVGFLAMLVVEEFAA